jgi:DNA repair exonuclease SbcCD ATPase subunit
MLLIVEARKRTGLRNLRSRENRVAVKEERDEEEEEEVTGNEPVTTELKQEDANGQDRMCLSLRGRPDKPPDPTSAAEVRDLQAELESYRSELEAQKARAQLAEENAEKLLRDAETAQQKHEAEQSESKKIQADLERRVEHLQTRCDETEKCLTIEKQLRESAEEKVCAKIAQYEELKRTLDETVRKLAGSEARVSDLQKALEKVRTSRDLAKGSLQAAKLKGAFLRKDLQEAQQTISTLSSVDRSDDTLRQALQAKEAKLAQYEEIMEEHSAQITEVRTKNANLMAQVSVMEDEMRTLERDLEESRSTVTALENDLSRARSKIRHLEERSRPETSSEMGGTHNAEETSHAQASKNVSTLTPPSSDLEQRTENVRKTYVRVKQKYDHIYAMAHKHVSLANGMNLSTFGEFGSSLKRLRRAVEERDNDGGKEPTNT